MRTILRCPTSDQSGDCDQPPGLQAVSARRFNKAREAGASTIAAVGTEAPEQIADIVVRTCPNETAATFTVSHLASLTVLAKLVAGLRGPNTERFIAAMHAVPQAVRTTLAAPPPVEGRRSVRAHRAPEIDRLRPRAITADEAALKIKEGAHLWAEVMSTEFSCTASPSCSGPP